MICIHYYINTVEYCLLALSSVFMSGGINEMNCFISQPGSDSLIIFSGLIHMEIPAKLLQKKNAHSETSSGTQGQIVGRGKVGKGEKKVGATFLR